MKKILVTGGTTFVSKCVAEYFANSGYEVYVLNRNTKSQVPGVNLIVADRHNLGEKIKGYNFDVIVDITAYDASDIIDLSNALGDFGQYIMISSSAVYPEYETQPFKENSPKGLNKFWGQYGTDKIAAETALLERVKDAYILRPPYLYGVYNNVYREAFVFDCALANRKFYLPKDGSMRLQFFNVKDLCKVIDVIISEKPKDHILNVGNEEMVTVKDWVTICYECLGKSPFFENVYDNIEQRKYFSFYDYEYRLDVSLQQKIINNTIPLAEGLKESLEWYLMHESEVMKKPFIEFVDKILINDRRLARDYNQGIM